LVIDEKADQYYKAKGVVVGGSMPNVVFGKTPIPRPNSTTVVLTPIDNETVNNGSTHSDDDRATHISDSYHSGSGSSSPSKTNSLKKESRNGFSNDDDGSSYGPSPTPPASSASPSPVPMLKKSGNSSNFLDLNMTAQEMRAKLAAKKKDKMDPKNQKIDLQKKYDIIQTL